MFPIVVLRGDDRFRTHRFRHAPLSAWTTPQPHTPPLSPAHTAKQAFGGLTAREREVTILVAQGKSNQTIADALVITKRTVETHIGNIMFKLGCTSRTQIAVWAVETGLVRQAETESST